MIVQLTPSEIIEAVIGGVLRRAFAIEHKLPPAYGADPDLDWQRDVEGALAEKALAKHLDVVWCWQVGTMGGKDLGLNIQARSTPRTGGHLLLHKADADDDVFYLLVGRDGRYDIRGSIMGRDGKAHAGTRWRDSNGNGRFCYWVPQSALIPCAEDARPAMRQWKEPTPPQPEDGLDYWVREFEHGTTQRAK